MAILNYWQVNLIGYLLSMAVFCHHYKKAVENAQNETAATITLQLIGAISILFLTPLTTLKFPATTSSYILLILASVFYAINNRLQTTARKHLEVSSFSVLNQFSFVFLAILGVVFLKEGLSLTKLMAVGLIIFGNSLILLKNASITPNKYLIISLLASLTASIGVFISVGLSRQFNLAVYISLTYIIPALILKVYKRVSLKDISRVFTGSTRKHYLIAGIFWGIAIHCSIRGMQLGEVSVMAPLQSVSVLINVVSGYVFLGERTLIYKKIAAASLVVLGIYVNTM